MWLSCFLASSNSLFVSSSLIDNVFSKQEGYDVKDDDKIIKLLSKMTIGVEIESEGEASVAVRYAEKLNGWDCREDNSLQDRRS